MPFDRPSLEELVALVRADLRTRLAIVGAIVRRSATNILAEAWAGALNGTYGNLAFLALQLFADTATDEFLLRIASLYGLTPNPATFASGTVTATGTPAAAIPVDEILVRDDDVEYVVTVGTVIGGGGTATVQVEAVEAGQDGNLTDDPSFLDFQSPLPSVDTQVTVDTPPGITGGSDQETIEELRIRLLERLRRPPTGGNDDDYIAFAKSVTGVTRVWVFRHELGLGTVVVRFVRDNEAPIFPDAGEIADVQTAIDDQRPTTAEVTVLAPLQLLMPFTLTLEPNTAASQAAAEAALDDQLFRDAEPGDGAGRGTIFLSAVQGALGSLLGTDLTDFQITVPAGDTVPGVGELIERGAMTYL